MIYNLANADILKFDKVLNLTVNECFNFMAYSADFNRIQNKKNANK